MSTETGKKINVLRDDWEHMGERILLSDEAAAQILARQNVMRYATVDSVTLASFVRGVRQV